MKEYTIEEIQNTKDPEILSEVLRRGKDDLNSQYAAANPNCPSETLAEVLKRERDDDVSWWAALNPKCPSETLAEVLRRNINDLVSWKTNVLNSDYLSKDKIKVLRKIQNNDIPFGIVQNPNCPPELKLEWYEKTGQLTKYDPETFELEHNEEDKDLEELRKLL